MAIRTKMSREQRAKQFMPFAALKGYEEALREKEKIIVPKIELSEEMKDEIGRTLSVIKKNDMARVVYFNGEEYEEITGMVSNISLDSRILKIVNTKILFSDIYRLEVLLKKQC